MDVDEAGGDDLTGRIELLPGVGDVADRDDAPVVDADVGAPLRGPRAVDDDPLPDGEVDHGAVRERRSSAVAVESTSPPTTATP